MAKTQVTLWTIDALKVGGTIHQTATGRAWTITTVQYTGRTRKTSIHCHGKTRRKVEREVVVTVE